MPRILTSRNVFDREYVRGAATHQLHAFSGEVAYRAVFRRQDGSRWQYAQSQQMGKVTGIGFVATMLEARVFLDRGCVSQVQREAGILESVDQPVPIESGFDHDPCQLCLLRFNKPNDLFKIIG